MAGFGAGIIDEIAYGGASSLLKITIVIFIAIIFFIKIYAVIKKYNKLS